MTRIHLPMSGNRTVVFFCLIDNGKCDLILLFGFLFIVSAMSSLIHTASKRIWLFPLFFPCISSKSMELWIKIKLVEKKNQLFSGLINSSVSINYFKCNGPLTNGSIHSFNHAAVFFFLCAPSLSSLHSIDAFPHWWYNNAEVRLSVYCRNYHPIKCIHVIDHFHSLQKLLMNIQSNHLIIRGFLIPFILGSY